MQKLGQADPLAVKAAVQWLSRAIGDRLGPDLLAIYHKLSRPTPFSPNAKAAGERALKNRALALLTACQHPQAAYLAQEQLASAQNMTDEMAALIALTHIGGKKAEAVMTEFYDKWQQNALVIDKWFSVQAMRAHPSGLEAIIALTEHKAYQGTNPNRVRALIGGFAMGNTSLFHQYDGRGYVFFRDQILEIDTRNPGLAARLLSAFSIWRKLDSHRQSLIKHSLEHIIEAKPSKNTLEIAQKTLG